MISLILAAAVAATQPQLGRQDLDAVITHNNLGIYDRLSERRFEQRSPRGEIKYYCDLSREASSAVYSLKRELNRGYAVVLDDEIRERVGGSPVYKLSDGDRKIYEDKILFMQERTDHYKSMCENP